MAKSKSSSQKRMWANARELSERTGRSVRECRSELALRPKALEEARATKQPAPGLEMAPQVFDGNWPAGPQKQDDSQRERLLVAKKLLAMTGDTGLACEAIHLVASLQLDLTGWGQRDG